VRGYNGVAPLKNPEKTMNGPSVRVPNFCPNRNSGRPVGRPMTNVLPYRKSRRVKLIARPSSRPCRAHYPWEEWFRRGRFTLRKGVDYMHRTDVMAQQARNYASRRFQNIKLSIRIDSEEQSLTVTVMELAPCP